MRPRTFLILFVTFALMFAVQCQKLSGVPEELIGVWVTKNPDYSDRPFEIKKNTVIFEQGLGYLDFDVFPIAGVKKTEYEGQTLYTIYYNISSGKKFEFSFFYSAADGGEIRFKNQPEMVWTKKQS
jgi:hypothetical protein